jgi:hypothetical protein
MDSGWWKQDVNISTQHFVHVFMVDGCGFDKKPVKNVRTSSSVSKRKVNRLSPG